MLTQVVLFLAEALCSFFSILFLARFVMQAQRISFYSPVGQFVIRLTNWAVLPLRRILPGFFGLDLASLISAWLLQLIFVGCKFAVLSQLAIVDPASTALLLARYALLGLLRLAIHALIGVLILQAVLSWVNPYSPLAAPLNRLTQPLLAPIRRVLPNISGIDLSPLVALLLAQVLLMFL